MRRLHHLCIGSIGALIDTVTTPVSFDHGIRQRFLSDLAFAMRFIERAHGCVVFIRGRRPRCITDRGACQACSVVGGVGLFSWCHCILPANNTNRPCSSAVFTAWSLPASVSVMILMAIL